MGNQGHIKSFGDQHSMFTEHEVIDAMESHGKYGFGGLYNEC